MRLLSPIRTFLRYVFHRHRIESEMDAEFRTHLSLRAADLEREGLPPAEAERQARIEFGSYQRYKEECREALGTRLLQELAADVRYGLRQLRRNPGFAAVVVLTLALGIGGNTAVFSVVDAVLFRPLPFKNPDRIVWINQAFPLKFTSKPAFEWRSWAKGTKTLKDISVYTTGGVNWAGRGHPARIPSAEVSQAFFRMLGVRPLRGRTFAAGEEAANQPGAVILSYSLWKASWPSRRDALGQTIRINGRPFTVVGIMPKGFNFPSRSHLWFPFPLALSGQMFGKNGIMEKTLARLRPGFSIHQAAAEMEVIGKRDAAEDKMPFAPFVQVKTLHQAVVGNTRPALMLLFGAIGLVLLIACADAANLLLSHNTGRFREVAVRSALGASRWRLVRQLLAESVLLSLMGGALGLLLGWWATDLVRVVIPSYVPLTSRIGMDRWVLLFTLAVSIATGIVAGLVPGLRATHVNLTETLKEGGHGTRVRAGVGMRRLRSSFGVAEIALAFILLTGAVLAIRSFADLVRVKPGFRTDHLLATRVALLGPAYKSRSSRLEFYERVLRRARALTGVRGVTFANMLPLDSRTWGMILLDIPGYPLPARLEVKNPPSAFYTVVTPSYFHAMGIPLLKGRDFTAQDNKGSTRVAIINRAMAQRFWKKGSALGKRFRLSGKGNKWLEVVGEVGDIRTIELGIAPKPQMYAPLAQQPISAGYLVVRTAGKPMAVAGSLTDIIHSIDPAEPVSSYFTMNQILSQSVASPRFRSLLLGAFAGLALLLAMAGVFGIMSYSVGQRTHEIGIRMALGAQKNDVLGMIVRQGIKLGLIGVAVGLAGAYALTRFLAGFLYGVKPTDPVTFVAVSLILIAVALLACYIPARRASKVDPMVALRYE